jgi:hypothetical protein
VAEARDSIDLRLTFPSPKAAIPIANALVAAGFPDVRLHVVVEATANAPDCDLQLLHDRVKELRPMIEAARGPDTKIE